MAKPSGSRRPRRYCCVRCDGPYKKWLKEYESRQKAKKKRSLKKEIQEQLGQDKE